jgi:beta-N-acetylhexosaminidase
VNEQQLSACLHDASPIATTRRRFLAGAGAAAAALAGSKLTFAEGSTMTATIDSLVGKTVERMTLTEQLGQLFMFPAVGVEMASSFLSSLQTVQPGGIIFFGANVGTDDQVKKFVGDIHGSMHPLPPLVAIDEEGGPVVRLPEDPVPGAVELGLMKNKTVRALGKERAQYLAEFGFDVNFAPVADIAYQATSVMATRSFGNNPKTVADKVSATVIGSAAGGVVAAAKHFPGHGRTTVDSHEAVPVVDISKQEWLKTDAEPFAAAVKSGVEMIMVGHLDFPQWDALPTSLSRVAMDTLRNDLDFDGVIVTDDLNMGALGGMDPSEVLKRAALGGADMLLYVAAPDSWPEMIGQLESLVRAGRVSRKRLIGNVKRIARLKYKHFQLAERAKG